MRNMKILRGILATLGLTTACSNAAPIEPAMKEIAYRGGLVRFEVPQDWLEEYEEGEGGMFYREGKSTGTLRLNVITARSAVVLPENEDLDILRTTRGVKSSDIRRLANGNALATHVDHSKEQGTLITLFWWHVTNVIPPTHVRVANFSYTVLTSNENNADTRAEVEMLGRSIENASFHTEIGQMAH